MHLGYDLLTMPSNVTFHTVPWQIWTVFAEPRYSLSFRFGPPCPIPGPPCSGTATLCAQSSPWFHQSTPFTTLFLPHPQQLYTHSPVSRLLAGTLCLTPILEFVKRGDRKGNRAGILAHGVCMRRSWRRRRGGHCGYQTTKHSHTCGVN